MVYFLMREPLPYPCPQCGTSVGARFNFCPNCKCNLHPSCPNCKREVAETDKYCPYCAHELGTASAPETAAQSSI
jgi:RNA polymerase subunit RPABC4/transcription elongation factor Spt4